MTKNSTLQRLASSPILVGLLLMLCFSKGFTFQTKEADLSLFNHDEYTLEPYIEIFEDTKNQFNIDSILADEANIGFEKNTREHINYSFTKSTIWVRLDIDYPVHSSNKLPDRTWYLEVDRAYLDVCELFIVNEDNSYTKLKADSSIRQEDRDIISPTSVFPVSLGIGDRKRIYVKIETIHTLYFHVNLWRPEAFLKHSTMQQLIYGFFYGGMAIVILYNAFLFFSTRDRNYLFYILYMGSITTLEFIELGHGLQVTGPLQDYLHKRHIPSIGWLSWAAILAFTMVYIETKKNHPFFHFMIQRMLIILVFNILIDPYVSYQTSVFALVFFSSICLILVPSISLYSWIKGNPNGEYFTYAIFASITGIMLYCLITMDVLPASKNLIAFFPLGIMSEAILFSFAIGNRINRAQEEAMKANQESFENLSRYQSLFENSKEGMYQIDLKGTLLRSNDALARILGIDNAKTLLAKPNILGNYFLQESGFNLDKALETNAHRSEFSFKNQSQQNKWVTHSAKLIKDTQDNPVAFEGIVIDITARKEREAAQKASLEETYRKELAAKESSETTHFLANMSYRIRTSLNSILGFAEIQTLDSASNDCKKTTALQGLTTSNNLLSLINKILDFSKLEANKLEIESIDTELTNLLEKTLSRAVSENLITVKYNYPMPSHVKTDSTRLLQCISEITDFAIENCTSNKPEITISYNNETQSLTVKAHYDSLKSIDNDSINIIDSFKQKSAWQIIHSKDSGLGFALTHKLAELLDGSLDIENMPENRSCISLSIPMKVLNNSKFCMNDRDLKALVSQKDKSSTSVQTLQGKVLVAEDNPVNQKLIQKILTKMGLDVSMATHGEDAIKLTKDSQYDVILLDLNMPVMDGFQTIKCLQEQNYPAPIYALTAENSPEAIAHCHSVGFVGHLEKPVKRQQIFDALATYLKKG